ncbi:DNA polymerase III subunit delta' [Salibacterium qingdaonense]|uniref:DNA polymerase III subunit delta' n=1 Tax=Salibacterium qingdaonense TaxID=266892 RepID=A0A1I4QRF5_9BACI|nr:DNA polymerase III subunit delta' [Salibacterium qingdaonense]SFM42654.1 DNA polymerase-3 subunit delta' [Salibacterium qingdaonense]
MDWNRMMEDQRVVMTMLKQSMEKNRLAHAYIFEGMRGAGKKDAAWLIAQSQFCPHRENAAPCGTCRECRRIKHGNHPDIIVVEPDGASIKKAQVEALQKELTYKGMETSFKIYIINDADRMTAGAANSLLKFLEEPESPILALLLTENVHFMLDTILSRAQKLSFAPPSPEKRARTYREEGASETAAPLLARLPDEAAGSYQGEATDWIVQGRALVIQLVEEVHSRPHQVLLTLQEKWIAHFKDREELDIGLDLLLFWYRDLLTVKHNGQDLAYPDQRETMEKQGLQMPETEIARILQLILDAKRKLRANVNAQLLMEHLLLRLQEGS